MELNSQNKARTPDQLTTLEGQIRECFGRVVYSHKTHEKCADLLLSRLGKIKLSQLILSALATGGFISTLLGSGNWAAIVGTLVSTTLLVLNSYTKDFDLGELAQKHRQAAADLWLIRERYLSLLTDIRMDGNKIDSYLERRDDLLNELHSLYSGAPSTNYEAYKKAQEALQKLEDLTFSDDEVDAFLPRELKRGEDK
ncbi:SLATT domain-containing protein [Pelagicoccus sp. SDUM812005]|uniref:SLATT domain-containing protein n=1 Tax=Pelagicoccus sp. SDUM812005 TaxID=3041257 RepID=UPI00280CA788|nr:SLATT domain-containing protein [Pelagicoccus sp. SDUM812005]MDQ8180360.1 SLATT domain-containing protein [Pelagicoccus sp. SDUM812005]